MGYSKLHRETYHSSAAQTFIRKIEGVHEGSLRAHEHINRHKQSNSFLRPFYPAHVNCCCCCCFVFILWYTYHSYVFLRVHHHSHGTTSQRHGTCRSGTSIQEETMSSERNNRVQNKHHYYT